MATKPPSQESGKQDAAVTKSNATADAGAGQPGNNQASKQADQEDQAKAASQAALDVQQQLLGRMRDEIGAMVADAIEPIKRALLDNTNAVGGIALTEQRTSQVLQQGEAVLTREEAARLVQRRTLLSDKGASLIVVSALSPDELLAWHDHGTHVVVVTVDGQKFSNAADAE